MRELHLARKGLTPPTRFARRIRSPLARVDRTGSADSRNWISIHVMPGIARRRWGEDAGRIFWCLYLDRRAIIAIRREANERRLPRSRGRKSFADLDAVAMGTSGKRDHNAPVFHQILTLETRMYFIIINPISHSCRTPRIARSRANTRNRPRTFIFLRSLMIAINLKGSLI